MHGSNHRFAGVELGGTKAIAVLAEGDAIVDRLSVPTTTPDATLGAMAERLRQWEGDGAVAGLGIASFGPVRLTRSADDFAHILTTPKPGWTGADLRRLAAALPGVPMAIDTDVNGAALAEYCWGAGRGAASLVYLTIGTGVGGGVLIDGRPVIGRLHPEIGHVGVRRLARDDFPGVCPFHGDCIEGLVSGPALWKRLGGDPADVARDDPRWRPVAHDLAQLFATLIHMLAPERILVGGGVGIGAGWLVAEARAMLPELLGGYYPDLDGDALAAMIRAPALGGEAGPMGAVALAQAASA
ncbi:ROK family protein [Sphingomonas sp.]